MRKGIEDGSCKEATTQKREQPIKLQKNALRNKQRQKIRRKYLIHTSLIVL